MAKLFYIKLSFISRNFFLHLISILSVSLFCACQESMAQEHYFKNDRKAEAQIGETGKGNNIEMYIEADKYLQPGQSKYDFQNNRLDAAPAINAALATGKNVKLPCGFFQINEMLKLTRDGQALSGASRSCSTLAINITIGSAIIYSGIHQSIHDLELDATKSNISGNIIHSKKSSSSHLYNLVIQGAVNNGIYLESSGGTQIDHVNFLPPYLDGKKPKDPQREQAYGTGAAIVLVGNTIEKRLTLDTYLNEINISQYRYGIQISNASGVYSGSGMNIVGCMHAIMVDPGSEETVNGVQFSNVLGDTSFSDNWLFTGEGLINEVMCVNCWASSSVSGAGLLSDNSNPLSGQITFSNSTFLNNYAEGISLNGMRNWNLTNIIVEMNSRKGKDQYPDIGIYKNTGDFIRLQSSFIGRGGRIAALGASTNTTYAVNAVQYNSRNHLMLLGNQAYDHVKAMFILSDQTENIVNEFNQGN